MDLFQRHSQVTWKLFGSLGSGFTVGVGRARPTGSHSSVLWPGLLSPPPTGLGAGRPFSLAGRNRYNSYSVTPADPSDPFSCFLAGRRECPPLRALVAPECSRDPVDLQPSLSGQLSSHELFPADHGCLDGPPRSCLSTVQLSVPVPQSGNSPGSKLGIR